MTQPGGDSVTKDRAWDGGTMPYAEAAFEPEDERWLLAQLGDRDVVSVRMEITTDADTEAHSSSFGSSAVRVRILSDEVDLEGHAFTLHFPAFHDADAFKRGVAAGAISATLLLGGVAGAVAVSQSHPAGGADQAAPAAAASHPKAAPGAGQQVVNVRWGRPVPQ